MNLQEFAALKAGDKIENPMNGSTGTVSETVHTGVRVKWGAGQMEFFYSANSTAWFHWSKVEPEDERGPDDAEFGMKP